jgi:hypothetical protein
MNQGRLKRLYSSHDGGHLVPEKAFADKTVFQNGSIDTILHLPLFSWDSTFKVRNAKFFEFFSYFQIHKLFLIFQMFRLMLTYVPERRIRI